MLLWFASFQLKLKPLFVEYFQNDYRTEEDLKKLESQVSKGPNPEIREHARKRALELKCVEMEDILKEQG